MTLRWWEKDEVAFADLVAGLSHLNSSTDGSLNAEYRKVVYALMRFANGYSDARDPYAGEARKFRSYVRHCAKWALDDKFLSSAVFRDLVHFQPMISNDEEVRKARERARRLDLTADEICGAQQSHQELVNAVAASDQAPSTINRDKVGERLGKLLYVVRCNLDHSEKTPFGPDEKKAKRDLRVLSVAFPVLHELVMRTLDEPRSRLAAYGTLRRGEPNHSAIADLGEPVPATVLGDVRQARGLPILSWRTDGEPVTMELYSSANLTPSRWETLDQFEGSAYRRILIPAVLTDRSHVVVTTYAAAHCEHLKADKIH